MFPGYIVLNAHCEMIQENSLQSAENPGYSCGNSIARFNKRLKLAKEWRKKYGFNSI